MTQDVSARYQLRKLGSGWVIWDTATDAPAAIEGFVQAEMTMKDADDLTDPLNHLVANDNDE